MQRSEAKGTEGKGCCSLNPGITGGRIKEEKKKARRKVFGQWLCSFSHIKAEFGTVTPKRQRVVAAKHNRTD